MTSAQLLPALLDLLDVGHVGQRAAGGHVGQNNRHALAASLGQPLGAIGQDIGRFGHEVDAAKGDRPALLVGRRQLGQLIAVAAKIGQADHLVLLIVVPQDQQPGTHLAAHAPNATDEVLVLQRLVRGQVEGRLRGLSGRLNHKWLLRRRLPAGRFRAASRSGSSSFWRSHTYNEMASTGQTSTHAPQSPHVSGSITAKPSFIEIASNGHDSTHVSQPVHFSRSTTAAIDISSKQGAKYPNAAGTFLAPLPVYTDRKRNLLRRKRYHYFICTQNRSLDYPPRRSHHPVLRWPDPWGQGGYHTESPCRVRRRGSRM